MDTRYLIQDDSCLSLSLYIYKSYMDTVWLSERSIEHIKLLTGTSSISIGDVPFRIFFLLESTWILHAMAMLQNKLPPVIIELNGVKHKI